MGQRHAATCSCYTLTLLRRPQWEAAFRVGGYIQSGSYKGTVESFGFRSVKLRHHRGPLFTVPFGVLGAVENMSRDWVIDKMTVDVSYDSDFDKANKLIKLIGKKLAADPEFAPNIIEPLKMQGVEQFGDYGIQIRLKMMTKPGEQFVIRHRPKDRRVERPASSPTKTWTTCTFP